MSIKRFFPGQKGNNDKKIEKHKDSPEQPDASNVQGSFVSEQRKVNHRQTQRREIFRVAYPPNAAPKVLDNFTIADLSTKAIRFTSAVNEENEASLSIDNRITLKIQFNDGEILEVEGKILNCYYDENSPQEKNFVCYFDSEIPASRLSKEQSYLLKHYPDFCKSKLM